MKTLALLLLAAANGGQQEAEDLFKKFGAEKNKESGTVTVIAVRPEKTEVKIGRVSANDLVLAERGISSNHARLYIDHNGQLFIADTDQHRIVVARCDGGDASLLEITRSRPDADDRPPTS